MNVRKIHEMPKPAKLDPGSCLVEVVDVVHGTGVPEEERGWWTEHMGYERMSIDALAEDSAECWYRETDQSGECKVTFRITGPDGRVWQTSVACVWNFNASAGRVVEVKP